MNRQQAKEMWPIMQAFAEGKVIQFRTNNISKWIETTTPTFDLLHEYRVKPEPKYRPFANREECWQEMLKHQPFGWVKEDVDNCNIVFIGRYGLSLNTGVGNDYYDYKKAFNLKFVDETPFGIKYE